MNDNLTTNASNEAESPALLVAAVGSALSLSEQFLYDLSMLPTGRNYVRIITKTAIKYRCYYKLGIFNLKILI